MGEPEEGTQARDTDDASADEGSQETAPSVNEDEPTVDTGRTTSPESEAVPSADEEAAIDESEYSPPENAPPSETADEEAEDSDEEVGVAQEIKEVMTDDDVTQDEDDGKAEDDQPPPERYQAINVSIPHSFLLHSEPEVTSGDEEPVVEEPVLER